MVRRIITVALGVALIVLGLAGWHVQVGAVIVGSVAVGLTSGDWFLDLVRAGRQPPRKRDGDPGSDPAA